MFIVQSRRQKEFIVLIYILVAFVKYLQTTSYNRYKSIVEVYKNHKAKQTKKKKLFGLPYISGLVVRFRSNITTRLGIISKDIASTL